MREISTSSQITAIGEITYKGLEGGFFAFYADTGEKYFPLNLEAPYKQHALKVKISAILKPEVRTIQMHGTPIELLSIEMIDTPSSAQ